MFDTANLFIEEITYELQQVQGELIDAALLFDQSEHLVFLMVEEETDTYKN